MADYQFNHHGNISIEKVESCVMFGSNKTDEWLANMEPQERDVKIMTAINAARKMRVTEKQCAKGARSEERGCH